MKILSRIAVSLAVLISLTACATTEVAQQNPAQGYSFTRKDYDLRYAWKTSPSDQGLRIEGLIKNVRAPRIENVEIRIALLNQARKVLAEGVAFPVPQPIGIDDYRRFDVFLKGARPAPGDLLQFLVDYTASAGQGSYSWTSSFTVDAATGLPVGGQPKKTEEEQW